MIGAQDFPRADLVSGNGSWPDLDLRPARDPDPLIPPGIYDARGVKGEVHHSLGGRLKFFLTLELIGGPHDGLQLRLISTLPRKGRGVSPSSKFYRSWVIANGGRRPTRRDRMSSAIFRDRLFSVRVETVTRDHLGRALLPEHRYSVVTELLPLPTPAPTPIPSPPPSPPPTPPNPREMGRGSKGLGCSDGNSSTSGGGLR